MIITWHCQPFHSLSVAVLYDILKLRSEVFVMEQNCVFLDLDDLDKQENTQHLYALSEGKVVAYARLLAEGESYPDHTSIGRVVVAASHRKEKLGHILMHHALGEITKRWPNYPIKIGAQSHLERFYQAHGFNVISEPYMEDGIEHYTMLNNSLLGVN
ncbi:GNAT family N-acetyltransferase [Marinomonas algarum]|uniref:GNAT family N-acetyltransferase n=1 Tax=Marinomonas algarum TaxID=2883105 RepID=A0A9X1LBR2_9GAMM|nr:GNAT family N-acetyltransferase [Marinomonas algarum]MCB5160752.1 GNAT family N-acetyltransferase [Marinomonas algarum]